MGKRLYVPYEAPQGRRVNAAGVLFHGCSARFEFITRARAPRTKRKAVSSLAAGLSESELGTIDAGLLIAFLWQIAGRPENASEGWRREKPLKPLVIVLVGVSPNPDNYSVHVGKRFQAERTKWKEADIDLFFLPSYSPKLSGIEPLWRDVKQHRMRRLSRDKLLDLKRDVDAALEGKAS